MTTGPAPDVVLVGSEITPEPPKDERPFLGALARLGITTDWSLWEGSTPPPGTLVIPRAAWTSHRREGDFRRWLAEAGRSGCRFVNRLALIEWNFDKRYLSELATAGVPVVPTLRFERGRAPPVSILFERLAPQAGLVLKPAVSASGEDTWRVSEPTPEADRRWRHLSRSRAVLAQPYVPEVVSSGEWSVVVIGGQVSHVTIKRAASGEFRVQHEHGGRTDLVPAADVPDRVMRGALAVHERLPDAPDYARLDGVLVDDRFLLMEAELIDPELYFRLFPPAAGRLAECIARHL